MARRKRKKYGDAHVRLYGWFLKTPAWQSLRVGPRALLLELYSLWNGTNNGELFLSIREAAERLHVSPNTVSSWFDMLIEKGFIKVAQLGAFSLKSRHATTWILTEHPVGDALPTKDFARWRAVDDAVGPASRRGGFRWNRSTHAHGENQNPASNIDTDGIKDCVKSADLSAQKRASRSQRLTPLKRRTVAHGIKDCDTDTVTMRSVNQITP